MKPVFFLNFKTYEQATGKRAIELAKIAEKVSHETGHKIIPVVQAVDLHAVASAVGIEIFAQHIDPVNFGSNTGKNMPEAIKNAGAAGTITNHAEDKQDNEFVERCVNRAREAGLKIMLCAETPKRAAVLAKFKPDLIAIEPPELIGGTLSVSTAKPEIITSAIDAVSKIAKIPVIAGAGINAREDVSKSIELGAAGVFVASAVVKSKHPEKALRELVSGMG
ncbi:MAG: triose-phosphate isomerase [Candidatus Diapherotrites archaeon]